MKFRTAALVAPMVLAMLGGCASGVRLDDAAPVETRSVTPGAGGAGGTGTPQSQVSTVDLAANQKGGLAAIPQEQRVVYFDYDSFIVREDSKPAVTANAKYLSADPTRRVTIEGHTDERGGREYNLALGQKRAESVRRSLELLGVRDNQMEAVSYGAERPAVQGGGEEAWSRNRRAEFTYR